MANIQLEEPQEKISFQLEYKVKNKLIMHGVLNQVRASVIQPCFCCYNALAEGHLV